MASYRTLMDRETDRQTGELTDRQGQLHRTCLQLSGSNKTSIGGPLVVKFIAEILSFYGAIQKVCTLKNGKFLTHLPPLVGFHSLLANSPLKCTYAFNTLPPPLTMKTKTCSISSI